MMVIIIEMYIVTNKDVLKDSIKGVAKILAHSMEIIRQSTTFLMVCSFAVFN